MEPQYTLALETTQDQLEFDFDFLGPLPNWAVNVPSHMWPLFALDVPLPPIPDGIDEVFAQSNPRTFNETGAATSATHSPFTFALSDGDDQGVETEDKGGICVDPQVEFPSPVVAIDESEGDSSEDDASEWSEPASVEAPDPATHPRVIAPMPRRSSRNNQSASTGIPGPSTIALDPKPLKPTRTRKVNQKRKRTDEDPSTSSILAFAAQENNNMITPELKSSGHSGSATRRRKAQSGAAIPVAQPASAAPHSSTRSVPLPRLLEIGAGFERPDFATTHKRGRGTSWNSTPCLMCGVSRRRRRLNDTAHTHRSAKPGNKRRMPWCACMQSIGVQYNAKSKSDFKHTNMANFGLVLLHRYPELIDDEFHHDQITGLAACDLRKWWDTCKDLQAAHKQGRLQEELEDMAKATEIEESLPRRKT